MSHSLLSTLQLSLRVVSSAAVPRQCVRTAHNLTKFKYFHPLRKITSNKKLYGKQGRGPKSPIPPMPAYPYGPNRLYPESDTGLYGNTRPQSGNKISKGRNKGKTLRRWYPNIRIETLRSEALGEDFTIKVRARIKKTIDKCGGLDQYLLGNTPARIKELGRLGWRLRWRVLTSPKMTKEYKLERQRLGRPAANSAMETFEEAWQKEEVRERILDQQTEAWEALKEKNRRFERHIEEHTPERMRPPIMSKDEGLLLKQHSLATLSPREILGREPALAIDYLEAEH